MDGDTIYHLMFTGKPDMDLILSLYVTERTIRDGRMSIARGFPQSF